MNVKKILIIIIFSSFSILLIAASIRIDKRMEMKYKPEGWLESVFKGELQEVKQMIEAGEDINIIDELGMTALMWAIYGDQYDMIQLLGESGIDINKRGEDGQTALHMASGMSYWFWWKKYIVPNPSIVTLLLRLIADINAKDNKGRTPLMSAVIGNHMEIGRILLESGADLHARDQDGITSLMISSNLCNPELVKLLIDAGATVNEQSELGYTPLMFAATGGWRIDYYEIRFSALTSSRETIKILLDSGADVNTQAYDGTTALMLSARICSPELVKILLKAGAEVNEKQNRGYTSLMFAAASGLMEGKWMRHKNRAKDTAKDTVKILLDAGADINAFDNGDKTALWWARQEREIILFTYYLKMLVRKHLVGK
jgi:ankyrin repeat protein